MGDGKQRRLRALTSSQNCYNRNGISSPNKECSRRRPRARQGVFIQYRALVVSRSLSCYRFSVARCSLGLLPLAASQLYRFADLCGQGELNSVRERTLLRKLAMPKSKYGMTNICHLSTGLSLPYVLGYDSTSSLSLTI